MTLVEFIAQSTTSNLQHKKSFFVKLLLSSKVLFMQVGAILLLIAIWQIAVDFHWVNGFMMGSPLLIWKSAIQLWKSGLLVKDVSVTALETGEGFIIGSLLGTLLGYLLWYSSLLAKVLQPFVVAFNGIPKIALAPLIIIWFGTGISSKVVLAFAATVVVSLLAAYQGAVELDPDYERLMIGFGATKFQVFLHLVTPGTMPWVMNALRINVGMALVGAVIGEFISSQSGIGHAVFVAGNLFELNMVWVGVIILSLMALVMYSMVSALEKFTIKGRPWK